MTTLIGKNKAVRWPQYMNGACLPSLPQRLQMEAAGVTEPRDRIILPISSLLIPTASGEVWTAFARKTIQHPDVEVQGYNADNIEAPLIGRAWCFQEHILAPRLLQYTATEIMWECNGMLICECGRVKPERYQRKKPFPRATNSVEEVAVLAQWRRIVEAYTMRALTYPSDKIPAISGVSRRIQQCLLPKASDRDDNRYLAGLWERDLLTGLAWCALGDPIDWSRATPYRAPTWSWASVEGMISWQQGSEINRNREPVARIIHASCDLAGQDPTGAVVGGKVTLSGLAIYVTVTEYRLAEYQRSWDQLRHSIMYAGPSTNDVESFRDGSRWIIESDYQWADSGELYIAPGEKLTCLRLGWVCESSTDGAEGAEVEPPTSRIRALLLRPSGLVKGTLERVGSTLAGDQDPLYGWFRDGKEIRVTIV